MSCLSDSCGWQVFSFMNCGEVDLMTASIRRTGTTNVSFKYKSIQPSVKYLIWRRVNYDRCRTRFNLIKAHIQNISFLKGYDRLILKLLLWKSDSNRLRLWMQVEVILGLHKAQYPSTLVMHALHLSIQYKALNYQREGCAKHCVCVCVRVCVCMSCICMRLSWAKSVPHI